MEPKIDFYRQHSPITDPGEYGEMFDGFPDDLVDLFGVINGFMLHYRTADHLKLPLTRQQRLEQRLHTIRRRLATLQKYNPEPLTTPRAVKEQQIGWCSDFAVMLTAILRHKGIPARMRVGYENYFQDDPYYGDHWITEFWDSAQARWRLADADVGTGALDQEQLEQTVKHKLKPGLDFTDLRPEVDFFPAPVGWQTARKGEVKVDLYRANKEWKGWPLLRGNLLHDFQGLNRLEMGLFDYLDDLHSKPEGEVTAADREVLDQIAAITVNPEENFERMREVFETMPRTRLLYSRLKLHGVLAGEHVALADALSGSDMDQLNLLAGMALEVSPEGDGDSLASTSPAERSSRIRKVTALDGSEGITILGARQNNLKNIDVHIPRNQLVVITGVSGSGKSSLAFDTIYAEGQRRYMESLSSLARRFSKQIEKPDVDKVIGLNPAVAIEQRKISSNSRSTVGSITDVIDYLRVLFARVGEMHCPQCGRDVTAHSAQEIARRLASLPEGTRFQLFAPVSRFGSQTADQRLAQARKEGFSAARVDGVLVELGEQLEEYPGEHDVELLVADLTVSDTGESANASRFFLQVVDHVDGALELGVGVVVILIGVRELRINSDRFCPYCEIYLPKLEPQLLNHNTVYGMCSECDGLGVQLQVDPELIVEYPERSLMDGVSNFYGLSGLRKSTSDHWRSMFRAIADYYHADLEAPWRDLPEEFRKAVLYGTGGENIHINFVSEDGSLQINRERQLHGVVHNINRLYRQTKSEGSRRYYMQFMRKLPCPECGGERLSKEARMVTLGDRRFPDVSGLSIRDLLEWVRGLRQTLDSYQRVVGDELLNEIEQRLKFICDVGLHYLTLDRPAPTLSGGEAQRIRLAGQLGSELMGVLYVLDEPSIGLHSRDQRALLGMLAHLRDGGNSVLVVEHDRDAMLAADWIIDMGPGAGAKGGEVVVEGTPKQVARASDSATGQYLAGKLSISAPNQDQLRQPIGWLNLEGATLHNLKDECLRFPLGVFMCVTGVSGSGKSSLVTQTLSPALERELHGRQTAPGPYRDLTGIEQLKRVVYITQAPIGRNPRSNPATYVKVFDHIRKLFASTEGAQERGFDAGTFSFNSKRGRCGACEGHGAIKVKLHYMADVWVKCRECEGQRYLPQVLDVRYKGWNIHEVLQMEIGQANEFFADQPRITHVLSTLIDVGLGYLRLGQSATTLSGGEAQRIKLAKELCSNGQGGTLYILDEPTSGLHFVDIQKLLDILHRLVDNGNTVMVIEHNLDVVKTADWIIDLGPEGGEEGGYLVAEGTPQQVCAVPESYTGQYLKEALQELAV
jgi:excinuclease ABC subunit A